METLLLQIPDAQGIFNYFVENASYLFVFIFMVIESSFIPFPSEVIVPPAVYLACVNTGAGASMSPYVVVIVATLGALVGAYINYFLALWIGKPVVYSFADSRIGHACLLNRQKVEKAEKYFADHGAASTFIGRLIPAVRQLISIPAGLSRMNLLKFSVFTFAGALIWNSVLGALGWWLSTTVPVDQLFTSIEKYNKYLSWAGLALLLICVALIVYKACSRKHKEAE